MSSAIVTLNERLQRVLPKNAFARGVTILVGGTASAQILLVLAAPVLTRLYTPEDFGLLAVYASLLALVGVVSSLRYELAIPLPEDEVEAANVAVLCLILVGLSTLLTGVLVWVLGSTVAEALGVPALANYLWLLPVGMLLSGAYSVFNYWAVRTKRFTAIAGTKLRQALATLAIQLAAFKLGGIALLFGQVAGQGVGTTRLGRSALTSAGFRQVSWRGIMKAAGRYRRFPIFSTWAGLVNTAGHQLPPVLFAAFFSAGSAGLYALAHRVLTIPASLIGGALSQVFLAHGADAQREARFSQMYVRLQDALLEIGMPPALLMIVLGPDLFSLVFGAAWKEAGSFSQWLVISVFFGFVVSPLSQIFIVLEKQKIGLILQLILFSVRLSGIMAGVLLKNLVLAIALFSLASTFGYVLYLVVGAHYAGENCFQWIYSLIYSACISFLLLTPVLLAKYLEIDWLLVYATLITLSLIMLRYHFLFKKVFKNEIQRRSY